ncbi:MAG TPA: GNAT family N-acetyltransferase [Candidatus Dormibacteraeota bacterium]|nr:GNAT family N-acetyltransferase [Candidatus Dormibacteraeota bacterium]
MRDSGAVTTPVPTLRSERLCLRPFSAIDPDSLLTFQERNRAHLWEPKRDEAFYTRDYQRAQITASIVAEQKGTDARFAAFESDGTQIVACVNLWSIRRGAIHAAVLGYSADVDYQQRSFAQEAASAVIDYAFDMLNLHRIEASYQPLNERSGRVLRKLGFAVEGYARDYLFIAGEWRDGILTSLTNNGWSPRSVASDAK